MVFINIYWWNSVGLIIAVICFGFFFYFPFLFVSVNALVFQFYCGGKPSEAKQHHYSILSTFIPNVGLMFRWELGQTSQGQFSLIRFFNALKLWWAFTKHSGMKETRRKKKKPQPIQPGTSEEDNSEPKSITDPHRAMHRGGGLFHLGSKEAVNVLQTAMSSNVNETTALMLMFVLSKAFCFDVIYFWTKNLSLEVKRPWAWSPPSGTNGNCHFTECHWNISGL